MATASATTDLATPWVGIAKLAASASPLMAPPVRAVFTSAPLFNKSDFSASKVWYPNSPEFNAKPGTPPVPNVVTAFQPIRVKSLVRP